MKHMTFTLKASLLGKLLLSLALFIGSADVWADDYTATLTFANSTIPDGWINGGNYGTSTYTSFSLNDGYIEATNNYGIHSLTSESTSLQISQGQKIVITARVKSGYTSVYQKVKIRYNLSGNTYTELKEFNKSDFTSNTEFVELEYEVATDKMSSCRLQFLAQAAAISKIEIKEASGEEITELVFNENAAIPDGFSSLTSATSIPDVYVKYTPVNGWNTICLPFRLKDSGTEESDMMDAIFGSGWKAYKLLSYSDGVLRFTRIVDYLKMLENTPHLVYTQDKQTMPEGGFHFENVEVTYSSNPRHTMDGATFQGTYVRKDYVENDDWYGVTPSGRIMKAGTGAFVRGYRAYFTGVSAPSAGAEVKMFIIGGDDIPTDVGFVKMVDADAKEVYNLAGQRIQKARKGIYIVNGKKVVIK